MSGRNSINGDEEERTTNLIIKPKGKTERPRLWSDAPEAPPEALLFTNSNAQAFEFVELL